MSTFLSLVNDQISGSKLAAAIKGSETYTTSFKSYITALGVCALYEKGRDNSSRWLDSFDILEPNEFIKLLSLNYSDKKKIDGKSFLTAIKAVIGKKEFTPLPK